MDKLQGYGWMIVGALAAVLVPTTGADRLLLGALRSLIPIPWERLALAALLLVAFSSLYFRSHWIATLRRLTRTVHALDREQARTRRLADDTERIALIIGDNLEEVASVGAGSGHGEMYLDGARAHAAKLLQVRDRLRGLASRLSARHLGDDAGSGEPPDADRPRPLPGGEA